MQSSAHLGQVVDQVLLPRSMRQQSRKLLRLEVREGGRRSTLRPTRTDRMDGHGKVGIPVIGPFSYMVLAFMKDIISILVQKYIVLTNDPVGLSKSVIFLLVFVILHAIGNLHVMWHPVILMGTDISTPVCTGQGSGRQTLLRRANSSFVRCCSCSVELPPICLRRT